MATCKACGDPINRELRRHALKRDGIKPAPSELDYCRECADELYRDTIRIRRVETHATGRGCPLERKNSDDSSPWQDNVIRQMEGN